MGGDGLRVSLTGRYSVQKAPPCNCYSQKDRNRSRCAGGNLHICIDKVDVYGGGCLRLGLLVQMLLLPGRIEFRFSQEGHRWGGVIDTPEIDRLAERAQAHLNDSPAP